MSNKAHESKCLQCGRCCLSKDPYWDSEAFRLRARLNGKACQFLNRETMKCTVYKNRHFRRPACLTCEEGIAQRIFPNDCPYVKDIPGYESIVEDYPDGESGSQETGQHGDGMRNLCKGIDL